MTHEELVQRWPRERAARVRDLVSKLDLCGCGNPSAAWRVIKHLLDRAENHARHARDGEAGSVGQRPVGAAVLDRHTQRGLRGLGPRDEFW